MGKKNRIRTKGKRSKQIGAVSMPPQPVITLDRSFINEMLKDPERAMANSRRARQYYLARGDI